LPITGEEQKTITILLRSRRRNNLGSKYADNSSVAKHQQRHWQKESDKYREKSDAFLHSVALIDAKRYARSLHYIRSHSRERYLNCWDDDPDKYD